ncbi:MULTISPECIES: competence type IV pilus assembly protein ComGB [unclassified Bacillus (in: firmicutes)]|uniref:competence type IV pilus assembly protein ComGB n=1 Tax=unclassified Bacillus (in: firmicutes) TaxID=185979 RepID=UPI00065F7A3E|nr:MULTISPECIES: competence type IV pilus assembly protein ComGB [unclassified Bacillus (in: firmicutes)]
MNDGFMMKKNKAWTNLEQARFLKCIGELLDRGYSMAEAVQSSRYYMPECRLEDINACYGSLKGGDTFFENLVRLNFDRQVISFVYFAEKHGGFATAFQDASKMIQNKQDTIKKLRKILSYPLFLLLFTFILFFFVQSILIPKFNSIFLTMNINKNFFLLFVQIIGNVLPSLFAFLLLLLIACYVSYYVYFRKLDIIVQMNLLARIPFIGKIVRHYFSYLLSLQLSYLLSSGFSIYECLQFFEENKEQKLYSRIGILAISQLKKGDRLDQAFMLFTFLDKELFQIIQHGQENGKLDQEFYYYGNHCLMQIEENIQKTMKVFQPTLYSVVGILIVSIYLSVLMPMFQLLDGF